MNQLNLFSRIQKELIHSWWVIAFILLCIFSYELRLNQTASMKSSLSHELHSLKATLTQEQERRRELQLELSSTEDPAWIEQKLISSFGVVPEGYKLISFPIE